MRVTGSSNYSLDCNVQSISASIEQFAGKHCRMPNPVWDTPFPQKSVKDYMSGKNPYVLVAIGGGYE